jgi:hypothetical protein
MLRWKQRCLFRFPTLHEPWRSRWASKTPESKVTEMYTHRQFGWIVFGLLCAIAVLTALWISFRVVIAKSAVQEPFMNWVRAGVDSDARAGNRCNVLESMDDAELEGARIEIVDESCEDGLPHTVDADRIRMTRSVWNGNRREDILRHERIHLLQRRDPLEWRKFYMEKWGYTDFSQASPTGAPAIDVRSNPDTADSPWVCWGNRYWFIPVYRDSKNPRIRDAETRVWDSRLGTWSDPPREWVSFFCEEGRCPHQLEHPHEISAEILTDTKDPWKTPAALLLREFQQNLSPEK